MSELADQGIPVAVTCRVLKLGRQTYYRRLARPVTDAEVTRAYRANALFDAHGDDPEFDYRFLADEARDAGQVMSERAAWSICAKNRWWSVFGTKTRGKGAKVGPPVNDDLVGRVFNAQAPDQLWLTNIANGLLRQYFPQGTDLSRWSAEDLEAVAHALNIRPRKTLGRRTPAGALDEHLLLAQQSGVASTG